MRSAVFFFVGKQVYCLEVFRGPRPDSTYNETRILRRGESTNITALPGVFIAVDEVL
jgi:hypothetical protein